MFRLQTWPWFGGQLYSNGQLDGQFYYNIDKWPHAAVIISPCGNANMISGLGANCGRRRGTRELWREDVCTSLLNNDVTVQLYGGIVTLIVHVCVYVTYHSRLSITKSPSAYSHTKPMKALAGVPYARIALLKKAKQVLLEQLRRSPTLLFDLSRTQSTNACL